MWWILAIIAILLIGYWYWCQIDISGFWIAPTDFLKDAELDMFAFYISGGKGYILVSSCGKILINDNTDIRIKWGKCENGEYHGDIIFSLIDTTFFPSCQKIIYNPCGKITLYKDDTMYAVLYKDPVLTELAHSRNTDLLQ